MYRERAKDPLGEKKKRESKPMEGPKPNPLEAVPLPSPRDSSVTVMSGATTREFEVAHQSVGDVRKLLQETFNIGREAVAIVNGREVSEEQVLNSKDRLEFVRRAGSKGALEAAARGR